MRSVNFKKKVASLSDALRGLVVCIDPASGASSMPGYAVYHNGRLLRSGVLVINSSANVQFRLGQLRSLLLANELAGPDVLVIEKISGRLAHPFLIWSVGVTVEALAPTHVLEIPTTEWKPYARADATYTKSDEADAKIFGTAVLDLGGIKPSPSTGAKRSSDNRGRTKVAGRRPAAKHKNRRGTRGVGR